MKTILFSSGQYFLYSLQARFRQAQYGIQFLLFPIFSLMLFLAVFTAVRMMGGDPGSIFYPFVAYVFFNHPLGVSMQATYFQFRSPVVSGPYLATPSGIYTTFGQLLAFSWESFTGLILALMVTFFLSRPGVFFPETILGFLLLMLLSIPVMRLGMALGMRFIFAHEISQFVMIGFFVILALPHNTKWLWVLLPFTASIELMEGKNAPQALFYGFLGICIWWVATHFFLKWSYNQYRAGKGVDRI